jgi:hypothetical protein
MRGPLAPAFLTIVVLCAAAAARAAVVTGPVTYPVNGHRYYLLSGGPGVTWAASEAEAVTLGGHLVTINDLPENAFVAQAFGTFNGTYWIGLNDAAAEGDYRWADGDPSAYRNWYPGQPGNAGASDDYAVLLTDATRQWLMRPAAAQVDGAIAEVVPEPATALVLTAAALLTLAAGRRHHR